MPENTELKLDLSHMNQTDKDALILETSKPPVNLEPDTPDTDGFVVYEKDGMNLLKLKDECILILRDAAVEGGEDAIAEAPIYLPTFAVKGTKYNKIRLLPEEKDSPFGIIQRNNEYSDRYKDVTCGKFKAVEVLAWLFERTGGEIA